MSTVHLYESLYKAILEDGKTFSEYEGSRNWVKTRIETLDKIFNKKKKVDVKFIMKRNCPPK